MYGVGEFFWGARWSEAATKVPVGAYIGYRWNMSTNRTCCICGYENTDPRDVKIHSNVREFAAEEFPVWRCGQCQSIHARDEVNLDDYYKRYPFFAQKLDWVLCGGYRRLLRRLKKAGV